MEFRSEKESIRQAMLDEQSRWLEEADKADSFTQIAIAKVIAEAFGTAAEKYKTKQTKGWGDDFTEKFYESELDERPDGYDELTAAPVLSDEG